MSKLAGKVAVVTGASKGIGAGIAKALAAEGAAVVVNYASSKAGADAVVDFFGEPHHGNGHGLGQLDDDVDEDGQRDEGDEGEDALEYGHVVTKKRPESPQCKEDASRPGNPVLGIR